ncbi:QacE family quaternary ammonium compound efflux SMR transporter [Planobispora rosea]|uniref:QacE family quaternary ammonium compound efflux SMR transporter n=1 Tax=Planobispora rosea TaxID=35762 RepID=A0A8J3S784_PLARO|nr:multidrug efflux SMR transporter [Planobispora rosea]GGT02389.1 QacE family quaternary ammonium compound efflux SMR transporter [Planobispora rosea]GIH88553.1 QacE family quaternary ammonium compound efflux SMR transporter [Planobispora rosea]
MAWLMVVAAGLFEVAMAYSLKLSDGFSQPLPSLGFAVSAVLSFALLALALKSLDVGTAYAVWTGIGAVGTATLGMILLGEDTSPIKIISVVLILAGVVGLNLAGGGH